MLYDLGPIYVSKNNMVLAVGSTESECATSQLGRYYFPASRSGLDQVL